MRMRAFLVLLLCGAGAACTQSPVPQADAEPQAAAAGCLPDQQGRFEAQLRGAMERDIVWTNAQMSCDGDVRPDGDGLRITVAGPLPDGQQLRFILGIDLNDTASGPAQALPTNLTVLVEGGSQLYATRGNDRCAVEDLKRATVVEGVESVSGRGYCLGPATDLGGESRLFVPTFTFTALSRAATAAH